MSRNKDTYRLWDHPNGTIYVVWTEYDPITGVSNQTKRVSTGTTDWKTAEQYRAQFIAGLNNPAPPKEPTIGYLLQRYAAERVPHLRSPDSVTNALKQLIPFFGALLPTHVTNRLLQQFALEAESKGLASGTVLRRLAVLKAALRYAEGNRWIAPMPPLRMPVRQPAPRDMWLTKDQVSTLIENAKSPHIELFIKLAVFTAARSGAILDLTWARVDLERRLIDFGRGWGNKRRAVVPMNTEIYSALVTARELAQSDYVIEFRGLPIKSIKPAFRRLCEACGIKASAHSLRHTAATWLVMDGISLREVARLLGNSEAMVEKVYGKHAPEYLSRAVNSLTLRPPTYDL